MRCTAEIVTKICVFIMSHTPVWENKVCKLLPAGVVTSVGALKEGWSDRKNTLSRVKSNGRWQED